MFNAKQIVALVAATAVTTLVGCGQAAPGSAGFVIKERQHLAGTASAKTATVNKTEGVIEIAAPAEFKGTGAIAMNFKLPERTVLATVNDIAKINVTLKTTSFLLSKTVATVDVTKAQMAANKAAVRFTGLEAKAYTIEINAFDAANKDIGKVTESVTVVANQTATVNSKLQLIGGGSTTPAPAGSGLDVNLEVVNGN